MPGSREARPSFFRYLTLAAQPEKYLPKSGQAAGSIYAAQAKWLAATYELDRSMGNAIMARWKREHQRRKNLWKAIQEQGLTV
jgi:hypothetical protein